MVSTLAGSNEYVIATTNAAIIVIEGSQQVGIRERTQQCCRAGKWQRGQVNNRVHIPAQRCKWLEKTCKMSEALGLPVRGAKLRVSEPEKLGSQTDASDAWVFARSVANDS